MLVVPAWVWRGGPVYWAVCTGIPVGVFLAALGYADSGIWLGAVVAFVVLSVLNGVLIARRMRKFWPAGADIDGSERVAVARAARTGRVIDDARLAPAAIGYADGLRDARADARRLHWLVWLFAVAVLVLAVVDTISGPLRVAIVSWLFVGFFVVELFWWPTRQDQLVANAERTAESARRALSEKR